jgi:pre-60S factor REI1
MNVLNETQEQQEAPPVIDPTQSLFDKHMSTTVQENVDYMYNKYGFFIPDKEYLTDLEGLVGYCAEKIKLGHTCLYCQKMFTTWRGCQEHMIHTRHAKLKYEAGVDLEEFDVFYDFSADDEEFLMSGIGNHKKKKKRNGNDYDKDMVIDEEGEDGDDDEDEDEDEWEDIDSDEEMEDGDNDKDSDDGMYAAYQDEIAQHGLDITPLGELIFPDGRIIGHRGLSRYYKQRISQQDNRTSVVAARRANAEQLYEGRVYDTYQGSNGNGDEGSNVNGNVNGNVNVLSKELVKAGLSIGATKGRQGHGILVAANGGTGNAASYTALSLYRYKAAVKKTRKEEFKARKLVQRTSCNMNKMDKKGNRMVTGVSVAHAPR